MMVVTSSENVLSLSLSEKNGERKERKMKREREKEKYRKKERRAQTNGKNDHTFLLSFTVFSLLGVQIAIPFPFRDR